MALCETEAIGLALQRKDPVWMTLARRWAKSAVIIFAIGAVSGAIVEFELGLLWPTYIKFIGAVIGLSLPSRASHSFWKLFSSASISTPGTIYPHEYIGCAPFPSGLEDFRRRGLS